MACTFCVVQDYVNGKYIVVEYWIKNLDERGWSGELNCLLYQCPNCGSYWEAEAYSSKVHEVTSEYVKANYGIAKHKKEA